MKISFRLFNGGDSRGRTGDLLNAIQALYQLSYTPKIITIACLAATLATRTITIVLKFACFVNEFSLVKANSGNKNKTFYARYPLRTIKAEATGTPKAFFVSAVPVRLMSFSSCR